jgi:hypothetical protein
MFNPKATNPHLSNNITQMRSGEFQPRFIAGGNQTAYYLGLKGNNMTAEMPSTTHYSTYEKIIKKHTKK